MLTKSTPELIKQQFHTVFISSDGKMYLFGEKVKPWERFEECSGVLTIAEWNEFEYGSSPIRIVSAEDIVAYLTAGTNGRTAVFLPETVVFAHSYTHSARVGVASDEGKPYTKLYDVFQYKGSMEDLANTNKPVKDLLKKKLGREDNIVYVESDPRSTSDGVLEPYAFIENALSALQQIAKEMVASSSENKADICEWCGKLEERPCHACKINYDHFNCGEGHPNFQMLPYKYCPMCGRKFELQTERRSNAKNL